MSLCKHILNGDSNRAITKTAESSLSGPYTQYNITVAAATMMGEGPRSIVHAALTDVIGGKRAFLL